MMKMKINEGRRTTYRRRQTIGGRRRSSAADKGCTGGGRTRRRRRSRKTKHEGGSGRRRKRPLFAINPMSKVPSIVDGRFKLFESHAILIYLARAFPWVADHWYPADLSKRAQINSVLDWHHSSLRSGTVKFVGNTVLAPLMGRSASPEEAAEGAKLLRKSLAKIETYWLKGNGRFLLGSSQPSIADLSLVCEIMQLELLDEKDCDQLLSPYKKTLQWIEDTKNATWAHFDEIHGVLYKAKERFRERRTGHSSTEAGKITEMRSKM